MKHGPLSLLILAAALAAAPAIAQRSVSGTIGGTPASVPAPAAAAVPAAVPATVPAALPAEPASAAETASVSAPAATAPAAPAGPLALTIPTPPASAASGGGSLLGTTFALLFVLALMLGLAWLMKRFGPKNFGGGNSNVKLVGSLSVGTRERILVVEVGEQWIVVGASPGRMNALATMPRQEGGEAAQPASVPGANFADWIKQTIDKRNGK